MQFLLVFVLSLLPSINLGSGKLVWGYSIPHIFIFRDLDCWIVEMSIVKKCYLLDIYSQSTFVINIIINIIGDEFQ